MDFGRLGEVSGSRGRGSSAVDNNGCGFVYMAILTHPKYTCKSVCPHYTIPMGIYPALGASWLLERLDVVLPKPLSVEPVVVVAAIVNIRVPSFLCSRN